MATLIRVALMGVILSFITGCSLLTRVVEDPEVKVTGIKVENITIKNAKVYLETEVYNPNRFDIKFVGYEYLLTVQNHKVVAGKDGERFTLKAKDKVKVTIPIELEFSEVYKAAKELIVKDKFEFKVSADLRLDLIVIGEKSFTVTKTAEIEVPKAKLLEEGVKRLFKR